MDNKLNKSCVFRVYVSNKRTLALCELVKALRLQANVADNRVLFGLEQLWPLRALGVYPRASETSRACVDIQDIQARPTRTPSRCSSGQCLQFIACLALVRPTLAPPLRP